MKKTLVILLAVMMVFAFAANAFAFTDNASIHNNEAVDVMSSAGILSGFPDGSFQPAGNLTRAQAAKMASYASEGKDISSAYTYANVFTDVKSTDWFTGYVMYCYQKGIISGRGNGTFDPNATVTPYELGKMMLVAVGYNSQIETFTGSNWKANVLSVANKVGLYDDMYGTVNYNAAISRENAAQVVFNGMQVDVVEYSNGGTTIITSDGTEIITGASKATAVLYANGNLYIYDEIEDEYLQGTTRTLIDLKFGDLLKLTGSRDKFGRPAVTWENDDDEIGSYAEAPKATIIVKKAGKTLAEVITDYNSGYKLEQDLSDNYLADAYWNAYHDHDFDYEVYIGDIVEVYMSGKTVQTAVVIEHEAAIITNIDTYVKSADEEDGVKAYVSFETSDGYEYTINDNDMPGYDAKTYVEDAIIAVVENWGSGDEDILASYVLEAVKGTVDVYTTSGGALTKVKMAGTTYEVSGVYDESPTAWTGYVNGNDGTYSLYTDKAGYVLASVVVEKGVVVKDDVVFLNNIWGQMSSGRDGDTLSVYAEIIKLDGTVSTIKVAKLDAEVLNTKADADAVITYLKTLGTETDNFGYQGFYTYEKNDDNSALNDLTTFTDSDLNQTVSTAELKASASKYAGKYLSSDTQYILVDGNYTDTPTVTLKTGGISVDTSKTYTGTLKQISKIFVLADGSEAQYVLAVTPDYTSLDTGDYLYVSEESSTKNSSGNWIVTAYDMDGKEVEIVVKGSAAPDANTFYTFSIDSDSVYTLSAATDGKLSITADADWDDESGWHDDLVYEGYHDTNIHVNDGSFTLSDIAAGKAVFVDLHDTDASGQYDRAITSIATLDRVAGEVQLHIYVDGTTGATVIFVVSAEIAS